MIVKVLFSLLLLAYLANANKTRAASNMYTAKLRAGQLSDSPSLELEYSTPDLSVLDFDDKAQSACIKGLWLFYENSKYNLETDGGVMYGMSVDDDFCFEFFKDFIDEITSVRHIGSPAIWDDDSVNMFSKTQFQGENLFVNRDNAKVNLKTESIILTGNAPWTVFSDSEYEGKKACLYPSTHTVSVSVKTLEFGFFQNTSTFGFDVESIKKGCTSDVELEFGREKVEDYERGGHGFFALPAGGSGTIVTPYSLVTFLLLTINLAVRHIYQ